MRLSFPFLPGYNRFSKRCHLISSQHCQQQLLRGATLWLPSTCKLLRLFLYKHLSFSRIFISLFIPWNWVSNFVLKKKEHCELLYSQESVICVPVPLYHCFGMIMGCLQMVTHSASIIWPSPVFNPAYVLKAVEAYK